MSTNMQNTTPTLKTESTYTPTHTFALRKAQAGFTLVEIGVVLFIIAMLSVFAAPKINAFLISGRTQPTAADLGAAMVRIRANAEGAGSTPYSSITAATLANTLRDHSNVMPVTGVGALATVEHKLGATGSLIAVAPATITTAGDSFTITLSTVNATACPDLAAQLQSNSEIISINGTVVMSNSTTTTPVVYNPQTAQNLCTAANTNTFVFTAR
jgi:prepilin-type N-terminal cleavage/methylation domain-containing protein